MQHILIDQPYYILDQDLSHEVVLQIMCECSIVLTISDHVSDRVNISIENMSDKISELIFIVKRSKNLAIDIKVQLFKKEGGFNCIGVYTVQDMQLSINFIQRHSAKQTQGSFTLLGIVYNKAEINFAGNLIIEKDASESKGSMSHKALVCGQDVFVKTIPNLEIKTNNVSCKHAATIQQIDQEELFYLQSKGIDNDAAKKLIIEGYLQGGKRHISSVLSKQFFIDKCASL